MPKRIRNTNRVRLELDTTEYDRMRIQLGRDWEWQGIVKLVDFVDRELGTDTGKLGPMHPKRGKK